MTPVAMLEECAPQIAPVTLAAIVQQESGGNRLALHDNTAGKSYAPTTVAEAARLTRELIAQGHSVDIGLAQINSKNLPGLGLNIDQVLDPCENLRAAQSILLRGWKQSGGDLRGALAVYNSGNPGSAIGQKYGASVFRHAGVTVPSIPGGRLAQWTASGGVAGAALPPVRPALTWTPQASPLAPKGGGLEVALR